LMSFILLGGLVFLLAFGVEVAAAMGIMAGIGLLLFVNQPLDYFATCAFHMMNSFTFTAIPLFVFMGAIFANTGTIGSLFRGAQKIVGNLPGSIASAVITANAVFGAMSGSSLAATATFGKICFPEMDKLGYNPRLALGSIAIAGTLSVLIPPSIILIAYGGYQDVSVGRLFAGGLIPGIILSLLLITTVVIQVKLNPSLAPVAPKLGMRERLTAFVDIAPFVGVIVLVLGTIFGGVMTPTEASALGAFLSIVLALAYRRMSFWALKESMWTAVTVTAMIAFVLFTARMLGQVFQYIGLTEAFSAFMIGLPLGKYGIFAIICVMYIILGCFFDAISMLVLTLPFVAPIIQSLGFHFVWFGVVYVVLAEIGLVTPPFGLNLFVLKGVVPKYEITTIFYGALPFLIPTAILVVLLVVFPELVLWFPSVLY